MALQCLAILGNKSEPLYFYAPPSKNKDETSVDDESDIFGFQADDAKSTGLTMRQEVSSTVSCTEVVMPL